jgi:hypothetical protein
VSTIAAMLDRITKIPFSPRSAVIRTWAEDSPESVPAEDYAIELAVAGSAQMYRVSEVMKHAA